MTARLPDLLNAIPPEGIPLEALAHLANQALELAQLAVHDKRATETLDGRTIRFYQSLGILPRPEYVGRRAMYGRDHLLRAIAAKQLQAEGYSLAQIQSALPAQSSDELLDALELAGGGAREETSGRHARKDMNRDAGHGVVGVDDLAPRPRAALGESSSAPSHSPTDTTSFARTSGAGRQLATHEIARGVFITIDPVLVPNPAALLQQLTNTTHRALAQRANHGGDI